MKQLRAIALLLALLVVQLLVTVAAVEAGAPATASWFSDGTLGHGAKPATGQALTGGSTLAGGTVAVAYGGTGANTASDARTALGGGLGRLPIVHTASSAPTTADDSSAGYQVGDIWRDTAAHLSYVADSVSVGAADWRQLLSPSGVEAYLSGGAWYARPIAVNQGTGALTSAGAAVAMSAEGTDYGASLSGTSLTLTGPLPGNTGGIQSNAGRWSVALSSLGLTLTPSGTRWVNTWGLCDTLGDNGEARVGTVDLGVYLGVGSTTALVGESVYRPSTGTNWGLNIFQAGATSFTSVTTNAALRGGIQRYGWPTNSQIVHTSAVNSTGGEVSSIGTSGAAISGSAPTHLVVYLRSSALASGAVFGNCRFTVVFSPALASM